MLRYFFIITIFAFISLSSCENNQSENVKETKLKVGYIPIADCAQLFIAKEKGYFKENGLDIEFTELQGGPKVLEALAGNSIQVGFSNVVSLILSKDGGLDFVSITGGPVEDQNHAEHAIVVLKESGINSISQLEGKTIAINSRKNIDDLFLQELLEKHKVDLSKVTIVEMPFPRMGNVLTAKEVNAICAIEPFVSFAIQSGNAKVLSYNYVELYPKVEISTFVVSRKWLDGNREAAEKFHHAIGQATEFAQKNQAEVKQIISKYTKLSSEQIKGVTLPAYDTKLTEAGLQSMADRLLARGWIKSKMNAQDLIIEMK